MAESRLQRRRVGGRPSRRVGGRGANTEAADAPPPTARAVVEELLGLPEHADRIRRLRSLLETRGTPGLVEELRGSAAGVLRRDPREADRRAQLGLLVADAAQDLRGRAACLVERAKACVLAGDAGLALEAVDQASRASRRVRDDAMQSQVGLLRLQTLIVLERYEEARSSGGRALAAFERRGDVNGRILAHMALADLEFRIDRPRDALRHYAQVDRILPSTSPPQAFGALAMNRANSLAACNRFRAAQRHFDRARELFRAARCEHTAAQVDYNAAFCDLLRGRYRDALRRYAECEQVFRRLDDARHLAHVDLDRAEIQLHLGMPDAAAACAASAERRFRAAGLAKERAQARFLLARAHDLRGDSAKALEQFDRAERMFRSLGLAERVLACVVARAGLAERGDDRDLARKLALAARAMVDGRMNPLSEATVDLLCARLDLADGRRAAAAAAAESTVALCRRVHAPLVLVEALRIVGRARLAMGDAAGAMSAYARAVDELERFRGGVPPDESMASFLGGRAAIYEEVIEAAAQAGDAANALEYAERAKTRIPFDLSAARRGAPAARLRHLRERLHAAYETISRRGDGEDPRSVRFVAEARARAKRIEECAAALRRDRAAKSGDEAGAPDLGEIRSHLDPSSAVVEYVVARRALYAFALTKTDVHVARREIRREEVAHLVDRCRYHVLRGRDAGPDPSDPVLCTTRNELGGLGELLLGPVASSLAGVRRLVVVPHGVLRRIPFHALHWNGKWLADAFEVIHAPSAAAYRGRPDERPSSDGTPAVFGLPAASAPRIEEECRRAARAIGRAKLCLRRDATSDRLREEAARARVLHIAAQASFQRGRAFRASTGSADAGLDLRRLDGLDVRGELVVLSTFGRDEAGDDDVDGFVNGLLAAGAPSVLTNEWPLDDVASDRFFSRFHQSLRAGAGAAAAHRNAMAAVRVRRPHPYFWASYSLVGRPLDPRRSGPAGRKRRALSEERT